MLQIEVKRTRGSVTQGMVYVHINGENVCSFGDKIEIIQESQIDSIIPDGTVVRLGVKTEKINVFDAEGKQNLLEGVRNDNAV